MTTNYEVTLEQIEKLINKNSDDVAVSIARSFERLEERIDAAESRIYSRLSAVEDTVESSRHDIVETIGDVRTDIREAQSREDVSDAD
jgi:acetyl-CoA carboxylase alpha subunit